MAVVVVGNGDNSEDVAVNVVGNVVDAVGVGDEDKVDMDRTAQKALRECVVVMDNT